MSAASVLSALDGNRYEPVPVGISRDGRWWTGPDCLRSLQRGRPEEAEPAVFIPDPTAPGLYVKGTGGQLVPVPVDVWFPVLHGPYGEDGTIQALLELADQPYVGCDVAASAVGLDKVRMKAAFAAVGLPQVPHVAVTAARWRAEPQAVAAEVARAIGFPCFVKPASLGSSVGVSRVDDERGLAPAMDEAAALSAGVLVEEAATGFREVEIGVLGNDDPLVSVPGEVRPAAGYYDYTAKYADDRTELLVPAPVKPETARTLAHMARKAFAAIGGSGLARVDFFLSPDETVVYVNEINTMPGFTRVSMYPRMWLSSGWTYEGLVDRLVELARERHEERRRIAHAQATWRAPGSPGAGREENGSGAPK